MLDLVAHSRLGVIDRRAPAIPAFTTLTQGGLGVRLLLAVLDGPAVRLDAYLRQLVAVADLIGGSTVVIDAMRGLAETFEPVVREAAPVVLEILGYEVSTPAGPSPEAIALAHPLRFTGPARLTARVADIAPTMRCTHSWRCHLRRTTSLAAAEALRRILSVPGHRDAAVLDGAGTIVDTTLSTLVTLDPDGNLRTVNTRCEACTDLLTVSIVDSIGASLAPALPTTPRDLTARSQGAWLIEPTGGVAELLAVDDLPITWTTAGRDTSARLAAALSSARVEPCFPPT